MESLWMSSRVSPFLEGDAWVGFRRRSDKAKMRSPIVVSRERISVLGDFDHRRYESKTLRRLIRIQKRFPESRPHFPPHLLCELVFLEAMDRPRWLKLVFLISLLMLCHGRTNLAFKFKHQDYSHIYNQTLAKILAEYASAVYMTDLTELFTWTCSRCNDLTKGFEMIELIVDVQYCLQAFVGVAHDLNAIIIAFRGTQENSIQNWIEDLLWKQLDLNYPNISDAMVHRGFYFAYHNTTVRPVVVNAVKRTRKLYGKFPVMVTGHSMGGAMASFCALDLAVNFGIHNVQLMTFGQPRVGNAAFASYFTEHVPKTIRVTNGNDIVPHLPPYYSLFPQKTYHHFPREVWTHNIGIGTLVYMIEQICDGSGEDPSCSRSVSGDSITDHKKYLGIDMQADTWGSCRIVMDYSALQYQMDLAGNIVLSKDPVSPSIIQSITQEDNTRSNVQN
ncbi:Lipase [Ananas comosus]|uniref:Lipase n=3 Tax=Ananas comosus TaxID=4615 RepID=A0A199W2S7_ANACO|nr:Lipase [Ananas comosus]